MTQGQRILSALSASLFSFYNLLLFSLMNVLGVYLIRDLHLSPLNLGFLSSCDLWGNVIGFLPIGILLDHYPIRRVGLIFIFLAIAATLGMAYVQNFWLLCLLRFLQGLASAASLLIIMRLGNSLFARNTNRNIGLMILLALSGGIAGNSLYANISARMGWQNGLIVIAGIGICCMLVMSFGLNEIKKIEEKPWLFKQLLKKNYLIAGMHLGILNSPIFILGSLFGNQYIMRETNLSLEQAAQYSSLLFAGIIIGSPLLGYLADRIGNVKLISIGYMGLIALSAILAFSSPLSYYHYLLIFFGFGFFCCTQNLIYPLIYQFHPFLRSTAMGISAIVSNALGAILQAVFGLVTNYSASYPFLAYQLLLVLFVIGWLSFR